ncbi:hypothetical protein EYE40_08540 [Glaciihabitans arcticus]|uniref:DUF4190 domain-containing protein n=1 Tax=Glaciihabitans arcticus TaxID=2668039 RepID=A0A4Q9GTE0_9MICO|nr:hypothetical protein [Glaciihabitans arcticus]TBN57434.1 hypothetical protein EYE40_08540 [Glaciihabitans arcticus]
MTYGPAESPEPTRNPLALVSFVLGAVAVLIAVVFVFIQAVVLGQGTLLSIGMVSAVHGVVSGVLGVGAIATGAIALIGPKPRKPLAAAGVALGAVEVFNVILGLLTGLIYSLAG